MATDRIDWHWDAVSDEVSDDERWELAGAHIGYFLKHQKSETGEIVRAWPPSLFLDAGFRSPVKPAIRIHPEAKGELRLTSRT